MRDGHMEKKRIKSQKGKKRKENDIESAKREREKRNFFFTSL